MEYNENFLTNLAKRFKIAQGVATKDHIRLLKKLDKLEKSQRTLIVNYFLTLENNIEIMTYLVKMISRYANSLSIDILTDMFLNKYEKENKEKVTVLKCEIANILGASKDSSCVLPLLYVLNNKDEHYKLRLACAEALGNIGSSYAVTPLIELVSDDEEKSMYLRESAAKALGRLGDMRAIEPLAHILEDKDDLFDRFTFLKERIVETLGQLGRFGDEKSLQALKHALKDESSAIRVGAIEALSEIEDEKVIPIIEEMLDDKDEEVARTAVFALYEILGTDYLKSLLKSTHIQECCIDEINDILSDCTKEGVEVKRD